MNYEDNDSLTVSGNGLGVPVDSYIENLKINVVRSEEDQQDYTELLTGIDQKLDQLLSTQEKASETVSENTISQNSLTMPVNKLSAGEQLLTLIVLTLLMIFVFLYFGLFPNRRK